MSTDIIRFPSPRASFGNGAPQYCDECRDLHLRLRVIGDLNLDDPDDDETPPGHWLDGVGGALYFADCGFPAAVISRVRDRRELAMATASDPPFRYPENPRRRRSIIVATERLYSSRLLTDRGELSAEFDAVLTVVERARARLVSIEINRHELSPDAIARLPELRAALQARATLPATEVVIVSDDREVIEAAWNQYAGTVLP